MKYGHLEIIQGSSCNLEIPLSGDEPGDLKKLVRKERSEEVGEEGAIWRHWL